MKRITSSTPGMLSSTIVALRRAALALRQPRFTPHKTATLCKSEGFVWFFWFIYFFHFFFFFMPLRWIWGANYILVSFGENHPDERRARLPFPAALCHPSLQTERRRSERTRRLKQIYTAVALKKMKKKTPRKFFLSGYGTRRLKGKKEIKNT